MKAFKTPIIFVALLAFFSGCAYYNTLFNAKKEYNSGIEIIQSEPEKDKHPKADNHFEQTIEKCWKLLEIYGDNNKYADDALLYILRSEFYLKQFGKAKIHAEKFLSKYPKSEYIPEVYLWQGKLALEDGDVEKGREWLNKCLINSRDEKIRAQANYELGNISFQDGDYAKAIEYFQKALSEELDKQYAAFIQFYLGESYYLQGNYPEAIRKFKKVEKYSPTLDIEYRTKFHLARSLAEIGKHRDALKILRKMLTAPRFKNFESFIRTEIAETTRKQGDLQEAVELLKEVVRARKSNEGTALASFRLGEIYENEIQNVDSAVYYYGEVKKIYSRFDSVEVAQNRHDFLAALKKIRDEIKRDERLVFRLEHDKFFRDSLYKAQLEDSLLQELKKLNPEQFKDSTQKETMFVDSLRLTNSGLTFKDSLMKALEDSLLRRQKDSTGNKPKLPDGYLGGDLPGDLPKKNQAKNQKKQPEKVLEKRKLPQIKEDLKNNRFHLAEFYLFEVQQLDSARFYYEKFLDTYQDSVLTPKALYSLWFIYGEKGDTTAARDSLARRLMREYPDSPFAEKIRKKHLGLEPTTTNSDSLDELAHRWFLEAESLLVAEKHQPALKKYLAVAELDTSLLWSAKARFARAWIFENVLGEVDSALHEYTLLKDKYPFQEFKTIAQAKTAPPGSSTPLTGTDTLLANATSGDSLQGGMGSGKEAVGPDDAGENLPSVAKTERYRLWRQRRASRQWQPIGEEGF
ncbi:MAG: hypothetical protein Kow0037_04180 [Calditrichia bacterium]